MKAIVALVIGMAAWLGVAVVSVLAVNAWQDDNQVLTFIPIAASVILAWLVGDWVTERVFLPGREEEVGHGNL